MASRSVELDARVLDSRAQGLSFGAIAREFALHSPGDAYQAFLRGFRRRPLLERARLRQEEHARLEQLRVALQRRDDLTPDQLQGRLHAIQRMRDAILTD